MLKPTSLVLAICVILTGLLLPSSAFCGPTAEDYYQIGYSFQNTGAYDKAIEAYSKAIVLKADFVDAYEARAWLYFSTSRYDEAIADYSKLTGLKPKNPWNYTNRGNAYAKKGQFDEAIADANLALILSRDITNAAIYAPYLTRGAAYLGKRQYKLALADWVRGIPFSNRWEEFRPQLEESYNKAVALDPNDAELYLLWGNAQICYSRYDQSIEAYSKAIALKPDYAEAYYQRASLNTNHYRGRNDQILLDLDQAIALKYSEIWLAYNLRSRVHFGKGSYEPALADINTLIALKPNYADAYSFRGGIYEKQNEPVLAMADYDRAIALEPEGYSRAYIHRGNLYNDKGQYDSAIADFSKALAHNSGSKEVYDGRATAYEGNGQYAEAIADWTEALRIYPELANELGPKIEKAKRAMAKGPEDFDGYMAGGKAYLAMAKYDQAIEAFSGAAVLKPQNTDPQIWLAFTYYTAGRFDLAISQAGGVIVVDTYNTDAYYIRGAAYYSQKKYSEAIADWRLARIYSSEDGPLRDSPMVVTKEMTQDFVEVYLRRADLYYNQQQYSPALADWAAAMKGGNWYPENWGAKIEGAFTKAIDANPKDAEAYTSMGYIYFYGSQLAQAITVFSKAIALKAGYGEAYLGRGLAYEKNAMYQEAINDLTKANQLGSDYDADYLAARINSLKTKLK